MAPPPPPVCFPFSGKRKEKRVGSEITGKYNASVRSSIDDYGDQYSPTVTLRTEVNDDLAIPALNGEHGAAKVTRNGTQKEKLSRSDTDRTKVGSGGTKKMFGGYGWGTGSGKRMEKEKALEEAAESLNEKMSAGPPTPSRRPSVRTVQSQPPLSRSNTKSSSRSKSTQASVQRPRFASNDSTSTLVGDGSSAMERKVADIGPAPLKIDTTERLERLRQIMQKDGLDYYVVPSADAHGSEYVSITDRRMEFISGFSGSMGQAVVSATGAYLVTDSRYWVHARQQLDRNWNVIEAGDGQGAPMDWQEWIVDRAREKAKGKIGIDARMITHADATALNSRLMKVNGKLFYPSQNLVDLVWKDKPLKSQQPIYVQHSEFSGQPAADKLLEVRDWIAAQAPSIPSYSKTPATPAQTHVGTLLTDLADIAWVLNLRGSDIPFNPLFPAYLYIGLDRAVLFVDPVKLQPAGGSIYSSGRESRASSSKEPSQIPVGPYLKNLNVEVRDYNDFWSFLRKRDWGEGKILISKKTSYAIALMITHMKYTVAPSFVSELKVVKNQTEIEGMRRAYIRESVAFVRWLAWLEGKLNEKYEITEYEAVQRLTEYRSKSNFYKTLAYENISASGANAALPHYSPNREQASFINRETPYLVDSGAQYRDGTTDTTRTMHFGQPTKEQMVAYTKVLQGHIAIDSAIFPEGTAGRALDVLARRALWKDYMNYNHGTGHGVGSFLNVHEGDLGFNSETPLRPGHVVTNEPGYYKEGEFGIRIESALLVIELQNNPDRQWLGFERLTMIPIQTKMIIPAMLTKEEKTWIKDHNQACLRQLEANTAIAQDSRAMKWLRREASRDLGIVSVPGVHIDWS